MRKILDIVAFMWCILFVVPIMAVFVVTGCGEIPSPSLPKEKFFRGNAVKHRLDGKVGMVIGKTYVKNYGDGTAHDVWKYEVRFSSAAVGNDASPYSTISIYEFELDPAQGEQPEAEKKP